MRKSLIGCIVLSLILAAASLGVQAGAYDSYLRVVEPLLSGNYDLGGRTVTISLNSAPTQFVGDKADPAKVALLAEVEKRFNCTIEFVTNGSTATRDKLIAGVLAGDPEADIWVTWDWVVDEILPREVLFPVGDILGLEFYDNVPAAFKGTDLATSYKGHIYGLPSGQDASGRALFYNKKLLADEGLTDIYELIMNDEWTYEKMTEYAVRLTKDTDGDGQIDQWGLGSITTGQDVLHFLCTNGASLVKTDEDGRARVALTDDDALAAIGQVKEWIGALNVMQPRDFNRTLRGEIAMDFFYYKSSGQAMNQLNPDTWGIALMPKGPHADTYASPAATVWPAVIPSTADDPQALLALFLSLYPLDVLADEVEDQWMNRLPSLEAYEMWLEIQESWVPVRFYGLRPIVETPIRVAIAGDATPASKMNEIKDQAQAALDDYFGQ